MASLSFASDRSNDSCPRKLSSRIGISQMNMKDAIQMPPNAGMTMAPLKVCIRARNGISAITQSSTAPTIVMIDAPTNARMALRVLRLYHARRGSGFSWIGFMVESGGLHPQENEKGGRRQADDDVAARRGSVLEAVHLEHERGRGRRL